MRVLGIMCCHYLDSGRVAHGSSACTRVACQLDVRRVALCQSCWDVAKNHGME